jgi:hypothetical protein
MNTSLMKLLNRFLKSTPEFIGFDIIKGVFNEMKDFYPSSIEWNQNPYTLKSHELTHSFDKIIKKFKYDKRFNNPNKWVNKSPPPSTLFDKSKEQQQIAYPYIQKVIIPDGSKILTIGDIHATVHSIIRILLRWMIKGYIDTHGVLKSNYYVVLDGDYVDFSNNGCEVWVLLNFIKMRNWNHFFMLRGNHEFWSLDNFTSQSTFANELEYKYGSEEALDTELYSISNGHDQMLKFKNQIMCVYNLLPHALLIGTKHDFIFSAHGRLDASYNAHALLRSRYSYDYLSAPHNFAYGANSSQNVIINGLYSDDPVTNPIINDLKALQTNYSNKHKKTHLIFRGHQHLILPDCFCFIRKGYPVGTSPNQTLLPGWQTPNNVSERIQRKIHKGSYKVDNTNYYGIFTLFTATGNSTRYDCFGKITTAKKCNQKKCNQWKFKLYQNDLNIPKDQKYLRGYAKIKLINHRDIITEYQQTPYEKPLF